MWPFRRRRRPPALDLAPLERLAELVERVVLLLEERRGDVVAPEGACVETTQSPLAASPPDPRPAAADPEAAVEDPTVPSEHVLFVGGPSGYALVAREGAPPARGATVEVEGAAYRVLRLGPSPLPGDARRCAFLERKERPWEPRTSDG